MRQFFAPRSAIGPDGTLMLEGEEFRHAVKVLRLRPGDRFWATDGQGTQYLAEVESLTRQALRGRILDRRVNAGEPETHVALAFAVPKGERADFLVEKATELGVMELIPLRTERSVRDAAGRVARWQRVALAAVKQCGRSRLPQIHRPLDFPEVVGILRDYHVGFIADPQASTGLPRSPLPSRILLLVGPEGGFTEEEVALAREAGFQAVRLGNRILRIETAALVLLGAIMNLRGEIG